VGRVRGAAQGAAAAEPKDCHGLEYLVSDLSFRLPPVTPVKNWDSFVNPLCGRKVRVQAGKTAAVKELAFCDLVFTKHLKAQEAWHHR